ncbi:MULTISPECIES: glycoside hydrolase family 55 protein [unclassified Flavobacterium]|uniref:glycoside hydrolase family 55 protein n=1 Tax=unclassified Flavobacterium TaxID=196869 RepID=UPI001F144F00|nr:MULTISPECIES: glycoside hydrolase family 55 protein [unclassified Flavobacterium]UMY65270.1 glycoside hydrolase family 55 protein [Flavobacterium sp. HJ-32-4]
MRIAIFCLLFVNLMFGQGVPQGFSHRGVINDSQNRPVANKDVVIRTTILDDDKEELYIETHRVKTNATGHYTIVIGQGERLLPSDPNFKLSDLKWGDATKTKSYRIEVDTTGSGNKFTINGTSQFFAVPYAFFSLNNLGSLTAKSSESNSCTATVDNIAALKARVPSARFERVCVKYYSSELDNGGGEFMWIPEYNPNGNPDVDNLWVNIHPGGIRNNDDGCIIQRTGDTSTGRWVRLIDGYINVTYYGVTGQKQPDDGERIQRAIDYAAYNAKYNPGITEGTIVYFPSGVYKIHNELVWKNGVSLRGESRFNTVLEAGYPTDPNAPSYSTNGGSLLKLDTGRVVGSHISDLSFQGIANETDSSKQKNCFSLEASTGEFGDGGLWNSTIKNVEIKGFNGTGIILKGRGDYTAPIQFNVFENISVTRQTPLSYSLYTNGQLGQNTFINCGFFAKFNYSMTNPSEFILGTNVLLSNATNNFNTVGIMSFINCTIENSEDGVNIQHAESVTFDTCWFESLNVAIQVHNGTGGFKSKAIHITNCRFANAAGFGSLKPNAFNQFGFGKCIVVNNSEVNVENCYATVSRIFREDDPTYTIIDTALNLDKKLFIYRSNSSQGVFTRANSFQHPVLSNTYGLTPSVSVSNSTLNLEQNVYCNVTASAAVTVATINTEMLPGERITLTNASTFNITFTKTGNLDFSATSSVVLGPNKTAEFVKRQLPNNSIKLQLVTVY